MLDTIVRSDGTATVAPEPGALEVWYSERHGWPKWHASWTCPGLEHASAIVSREFDGLIAAATDDAGRPCRMCLLEPALVLALRQDAGGQGTLTTCSSQGNPRERGKRFRFDDASESGMARLSRVAAAAGVPTAHAVVGPVLYGFFSPDTRTLLARNIRTLAVPGVADLPSPEVVASAWTLWNDDPPERLKDDDTRRVKVTSMWALAELLSR